MTEKERTWPYAVVPDAEHPRCYTVRKLDGRVVDFIGDGFTKARAEELRDLLNQAFDWGRNA